MRFLHCYSIDSNERTRIPLVLAITSLIFTAILYFVISILNLEMPWFLEPLYLSAPSAITIYFVLSLIFDKYLWNWVGFQKIGLIKTPDFNGIWIGKIVSSYDGYNRSYDVKISIIQHWTTINIILTTASSMSHSITAGIIINNPQRITLHYNYINEPVSAAATTMHMHRGTTWLIFDTDVDSLKGEYYSGRDRGTNGTLELVRE